MIKADTAQIHLEAYGLNFKSIEDADTLPLQSNTQSIEGAEDTN